MKRPHVKPCPCACNSGGFCGGCGHAGCGGRYALAHADRRYVERPGLGPGERLDVLTGEVMYSSRWL